MISELLESPDFKQTNSLEIASIFEQCEEDISVGRANSVIDSVGKHSTSK